MERNNYLTTGEFAKMMNISKHTLFHYDDIKLLTPEIIMDNGYRYYSLDQIETLDTILLLKDLKMPLKDIKDTLNNRTPKKMLDVFKNREKQIDQEIIKLKNMKEWINQKESKINDALKQDFNKIEIKEYPQRYYLYGEAKDKSGKAIYTKINELIEQLYSASSYQHYDIAYFQYEDNLKKGIFDEYHHTALLLNKKPDLNNYRILPKGKYLTAYHCGHWQDISKTYQRLFAYQKEHNIVCDNLYLEYYVVDNFIASDVNDFVTEIAVRVV